LAGSFAVLAGAAAVDPSLGPAPLILAAILFLWTPPHFWSLAFAYRADYAEAGVPMLPVVVDNGRAARIILLHALALVLLSLTLVAFGMGWIYAVCAALGGAWFVQACVRLVQRPDTKAAMGAFRASLVQLSLLLIGVLLDSWLLGS
jgi:protoheme IX farnesyltransferase